MVDRDERSQSAETANRGIGTPTVAREEPQHTPLSSRRLVGKQNGANTLSTILFANIQGLRNNTTNKVPFIKGMLEENNGILAAFTETHIKDQENSEVWIPGYNLYRADRKNRARGGVALYIKESLLGKEILNDSNDEVEILGVHIEARNLVVIVTYRPPQTKVEVFRPQLHKIKTAIEGLGNPTPSILWLGDFNLPEIKWQLVENHILANNVGEANARELMRVSDYYSLLQQIDKPTRGNNILDLVFTNNDSLIHSVNISNTTFSDHRMIEIQTNLANDKKSPVATPNTGTFSNFNFHSKNIKWEEVNQELQEIHWEELMNNRNPTECYALLTETMAHICNRHIPERRVRRRSKQDRVRRKLYARRKLLSERRNKPTITDMQIAAIDREIVMIEQRLRISYELESIEEENKAIADIKDNSKYFFSYAKRKSKTTSNIGPLKKEDGSFTDDNKEMSELLRHQYETVFSNPDRSKIITDQQEFFMTNPETGNPQILDIEFGPKDIVDAITSMSSNSAAGPDTWSSILIKNCKENLGVPLAIMWRKSLDSGEIPESLKFATIAPLHKGGCKAQPKNYRPVALTSHIIKIFERVLRGRISQFLEMNDLHNPGQHGFRAGRSCLSQLLEHYDKTLDALEENKNVDVIYTDFAKAFDKCDHGIIAHKLKAKGVSGKLGRWIYNFLINRRQSIVVNKVRSEHSNVKSSVPQGTVLAPLLFLILISDININTRHSTVSSFADDTKLSMTINSHEDTALLQADVDAVFEWTRLNNMQFNEEKFQLLRYGKNEDIKDNTNYVTEANHIIERKNNARDLGVIMSVTLHFKEHNQIKIVNAKKLTGWILRTFKTRDELPMLTLFKSLVLSRLEYCSVLTSPYKIGEINELESVQRNFTSHINSVNHLHYWDRLKALKLYSLERRRERYQIIYVWKIIEGLVPNLHTRIIISWHERRGWECEIPRIKNRGTSGTVREGWLSHKGPRLFNKLPKKVRDLRGVSLDKFKRALDDVLQGVPDEPIFSGMRATPSNSLLHQMSTHNDRHRARRCR